MTNALLEYSTVFILAAFVGIEIISKVPSILHTPLMSGSNAIHGVILVVILLFLPQGLVTGLADYSKIRLARRRLAAGEG